MSPPGDGFKGPRDTACSSPYVSLSKGEYIEHPSWRGLPPWLRGEVRVPQRCRCLFEPRSWRKDKDEKKGTSTAPARHSKVPNVEGVSKTAQFLNQNQTLCSFYCDALIRFVQCQARSLALKSTNSARLLFSSPTGRELLSELVTCETMAYDRAWRRRTIGCRLGI